MQGNGGEPNGAQGRARADAPAPLTRRDFAKRAGVGTVAAAGLVWAAPHISTVKYVRRAAVGSPPPTTDSSTPVSPLGGELGVSATDPCIGGQVHVTGQGFAPKTGVTVELDSSAMPIGLGNSDAAGNFDLLITLPKPGPTGAHTLRAVGVQPGGQTLTLSAPLVIKSEAECALGVENVPVTAPTAVSPSSGVGSGDGGSLPFTGGNVTELALLGGAAAVGGRAIYGAAQRRAREIDDTET